MKKNFWLTMALAAVFSSSFVACSDDDDNKGGGGQEEVVTSEALYFLNCGKQGSNNGTLTAYNPKEDVLTSDVFFAQNNRKLGDMAQDVIAYGHKMYIAVYGESAIEITDLKAKSIKRIETEGQPRFMVADGGKVYITYYNGYVARLDTASLEVNATVKVGRNPEQLAIANNKLYVANSGGMDYNTEVGYDKTVSIVDIASFKEEKKLEVGVNPVNVQADKNGNVYVIVMGNYMDVMNQLVRIDGKTGEVSAVKELPQATEMTIMGNTMYAFYSQYDANWNQTITYYLYDLDTKSVKESFITGATIATPNKICSDEATNTVYITASNSTNNGDAYALDKTGKFLKKYEVGVYPMKAIRITE